MSITSGIRNDVFAPNIVYMQYFRWKGDSFEILDKFLANCRINDAPLPISGKIGIFAKIPIANYTWATCKVALFLRYEITGSFLTVVARNRSFNFAEREKESFYGARVPRPSRARHEYRK